MMLIIVNIVLWIYIIFKINIIENRIDELNLSTAFL